MEETLSGSVTAFDWVLAATLIGLAATLLTTPDLFKAIVMFIVFGLLMAITWGRLDAVDIALAEAAIGAGLTGALFINARGDLEARAHPGTPGAGEAGTEAGDGAAGRPAQAPADARELPGRARRALTALLMLPVAAAVAWAVLDVPAQMQGVLPWAAAHAGASGVENLVTAVLLNFRAYDTLLELVILLLAVAGAWSQRHVAAHLHAEEPSPVLRTAVRVLTPLNVLIGGYLLWLGSHAPGGAFQAGAVLGGGGVLLLLSARSLPERWRGWPLRLALSTGVLVFTGAGLLGLVRDRAFLFWRNDQAATWILVIETVATLSIALALVAVFAGTPPAARAATSTTATPGDEDRS